MVKWQELTFGSFLMKTPQYVQTNHLSTFVWVKIVEKFNSWVNVNDFDRF